jgi:diguanylate cyclase (GGDEF)-like protein/PAS domain S-box-containing protein
VWPIPPRSRRNKLVEPIDGLFREFGRARRLLRGSHSRVCARPYRWAAWTLTALLVMTACATLFTAQVKRDEARRRIDRDASLAVQTIDRRLQAYGEVLVAVRGLFQIDPHPSRARFARFVRSLQLGERYPGVRVVSFARSIDSAGVARLTRDVRRDATAQGAGYPSFAVHPAGRRTRLVVLDYLEPVAGNEPALGFDLLTDSRRARAVEMAHSTDRPVATAPTRLIQDPTNRKAFVFMLAVRNAGGPRTNPRAGRLLGVVSAAFKVDDLLDAIIGDSVGEADLEIFDVGPTAAATSNPPSRATLIYDRDDSLNALRRAGAPHALVPIDVGGRRWLVYFEARGAAASTAGASLPWVVAIGGTLASLLASWLLLTLARGRSLALVLAGRMTRDLERSERQTRQILEAAHDAFLAIDADGQITDWNGQAHAVFGWSRDEALGRELAGLIVPAARRKSHRRALQRFVETGGGPLLGRLVELTAVHRDGREFPVELTISAAVASEGGCSFHAFVRDISARKASEELLERQRRQLVEAQSVGGFGSWEWDVSAGTIEWSAELCRIYGLEPGPKRGFEEWLAIGHPDDRAQMQATVQTAYESRQPFALEHRIVRSDGAVRMIHGRGEVISDDAGRPLRMLGTGQDVTDRKAAEEARGRLAALVDSSEDAIIAETLDGVIESWNRGAQELFGYSAEETVGQPIAMLVVPERQDELAQILAQIKRGERVEALETVRIAKSGRAIDVSLRISLVYDADGELVGASSISRDITPQKLLEAKLRRNSRHYELSRDLACTASLDGYFIQLNAAWTRTLGWSEDELRSRRFVEFVHPDDREATEREMAAVEIGGTSVAFVNRYRTKQGGWCWLEWNTMAAPDEDVSYATARDITERMQMQAALRDAEQLFRTAFDRAPIGVCLLSLDAREPGRLMQVNPALAQMLGASVEELTGMPVNSLTDPADHAEVEAKLSELTGGDSGPVEFETRFMHRDGHPVWALISAAPLADGDGEQTLAVTHVMDISDRKHSERKLQHLADHDALTGLFNRRRFTEELERALRHAKRYDEAGAVLFLDLDGFKFVNDTLGHAAGDALIARVAGLLGADVRETDTLARVGGDEFAVLLPRSDETSAVLVAEKLLLTLRHTGLNSHEDLRAHVSCSIGIAVFRGDEELSADELVVEADIAMYDAKEAGKDRYAVYDRAEGRRAHMSIGQDWNERLRRAINDDSFVLHAQPIMSICSDATPWFELLLRLPNDDGDLIRPGSFLHNAERFGLVGQIDRWVLEQAVRRLHDSHAAGIDLMLSVNVSGTTMGDPKFGADVAELLSRYPIPPGRLVIEITETAAITNIERARPLSLQLRALGCKLALDDFGAGFASFHYLKDLRFDYLKIDGEFIRNLCANPTDQLVVKAIVAIAQGLGTRTVAEFVGDDATVPRLQQLGVDYAQGYHLRRPRPVDQALAGLIRPPDGAPTSLTPARTARLGSRSPHRPSAARQRADRR